jgi:hypothetical protein
MIIPWRRQPGFERERSLFAFANGTRRRKISLIFTQRKHRNIGLDVLVYANTGFV